MFRGEVVGSIWKSTTGNGSLLAGLNCFGDAGCVVGSVTVIVTVVIQGGSERATPVSISPVITRVWPLVTMLVTVTGSGFGITSIAVIDVCPMCSDDSVDDSLLSTGEDFDAGVP